MDIFKNAETAVESFSVTKSTNSPLGNMSDAAVSTSALREHAENEKFLESQARLDAIDKHARYQELTEGVINRTLHESRMEYKIGSILKIGKDKIFKDILFEVFYNALLMDKDFLEENKNTLQGLTDQYVDENGGYSLLENAVLHTNSELLKRMKTNIDKIAMEVCNRKIADCTSGVETDILDFNMNEEETAKLDYTKDELNVDKIADLVKDKVLTVVKDEKEHQENEASLIQDIEDDLREDGSVTDEKSLNEALQTIVLNKSVIEDSTLFDSLFRNSYQEYLTENVAIRTSDHEHLMDDKEDFRFYDTEIDDIDDTDDPDDTYVEDELNIDLILTEAGIDKETWKKMGDQHTETDKKQTKFTSRNFFEILKNMFTSTPTSYSKLWPRLLKMVESCKTMDEINYLRRDINAGKIQLAKLKQNKPERAKAIDEHLHWLETTYKVALNKRANEIKQGLKESTLADDEINMDLVLTEAITKYTLMETLYTLKLEDYSHENMRKVIHKMLNSSKI